MLQVVTGRNIAHAISKGSPPRLIQVSSRHPEKTHSALLQSIPPSQLLPPVQLDITKPETLLPAFQDAKVVVSLVGLLAGTPDEFDKVQWKGAENVARAAKAINAKLVHISAIGANASSNIPYMRTKGLAEKAVFQFCPDATVIRPSLVFGPDDNFFNVEPLHIRLLFITELFLTEILAIVTNSPVLAGVCQWEVPFPASLRARRSKSRRSHHAIRWQRQRSVWL